MWRLPKVDLSTHLFIRRNHHLAVFISATHCPLSHALTFCPVHWKQIPTLSSAKHCALTWHHILEPIALGKLLWAIKVFACSGYFFFFFNVGLSLACLGSLLTQCQLTSLIELCLYDLPPSPGVVVGRCGQMRVGARVFGRASGSLWVVQLTLASKQGLES